MANQNTGSLTSVAHYVGSPILIAILSFLAVPDNLQVLGIPTKYVIVLASVLMMILKALYAADVTSAPLEASQLSPPSPPANP